MEKKQQQPPQPQQPAEQALLLPVGFAQALRQYLGQQRHDEVAPFIAALANAPVVNVNQVEAAK